MAVDYYKTLGVARNASQADIQKAYRELARKHHPDMNPDKPGAVKKFQEIQAAFDVLNSSEKREMYDRYGDSFETMGQGAPHSQSWGAGPGGGFNAEASTSASSSANVSGRAARGWATYFRTSVGPPAGAAAGAVAAKRRRGRCHGRSDHPLRYRRQRGQGPIQSPTAVGRDGNDRRQDTTGP